MKFAINGKWRMLIALTVMVAMTPWLVRGAIRTMDGIHTSAIGWLRSDDPERQRYEKFVEDFEGGNFVLVSWDGCAIDELRLETLEDSLNPGTAHAPALTEQLVRRVYSGQSLLRELIAPPLELPEQKAIERLQGTLVGPDGITTCLVVILSEEGARRRSESIGWIHRQTREAAGLNDDEVFLVGPPIDALAIDLESNRNVDLFSIPSALFSLLLAWWCLRSVRLSVAILMVAGFGQLAMLGFLYYCGITMDAVLIVLPPLVFVLTVSAGIHLTNYYYEQVRAGAGADAPRLAIQQAWFPCSLAALTTAIGLASLLVSRIVPITLFGAFAACGVVVTVALLFLTLPGVMALWPMPIERLGGKDENNNDDTNNTDTDDNESNDNSPAPLGRARAMASWICRFSIPVTLLGMAALVAGGFGLDHVRTSINVRSLFAARSRVVRDFVWMEQNIGNLVPMEIVLHFPAGSSRMIDQLQIVDAVEKSVEAVDGVDGTISVATFSPIVPHGGHIRDVNVRSLFQNRMKAHQQRLLDSNFLNESPAGRDWRISAHVSGLQQVDFQQVLEAIREEVDPYVKQLGERLAPGLRATYTGTMPLVYRAQHILLEDMFNSLLLAFLLVWLVMSLLLADRSEMSSGNRVVEILRRVMIAVTSAALAMLPNVFPIVVVFGTMGWCNLPADIGSTMTACVALGIAVDDTLHFLSWFRRETGAGMPRFEAIQNSFHHCGRAMVQTTVVCGFGLLVFGLSEFVPTQRFAWLMFTLLMAALVADLVFLPAILASPLGKLFAPNVPAQLVETETEKTGEEGDENDSPERP